VRNQPKGFTLTAVHKQGDHVQQIYSDGLARVSVFVQSIGALPAAGYTQRGSTGFVVRRNGSVDLIAVGDVPQATLDRFLAGVEVVEQ
jgi:negative regulator of sigma E activity